MSDEIDESSEAPSQAETVEALTARVEALEEHLASRIVDARVLLLRDDDGKTRASLAIDKEGAVSLRFMDQEGTVRLQLLSGEQGGSLIMSNPEGQLRVGLYAASVESPIAALELRGDTDRPRLLLAAPEVKGSMVAFCDSKGKPVTGLVESGLYSVTPKEGGTVELPPGLESELRELFGDPSDEND